MSIYHDQQSRWDSIHGEGKLEAFSHGPTEFAREVISLLPAQAKIAELGCGLGNDQENLFGKQSSAVTVIARKICL